MTQQDIVTDEQLVPPGAKIVHGPYGFVQLKAFHGSDLEVVNAARVSFHKQSEWEDVPMGGDDDCPSAAYHATHHYCSECDFHLEKTLSEGDAGVLRFLLLNKHGTPFEHTYFQFLVRAPIFVFREWHRHRIGVSINEESARYVSLRPDFYVPRGEALRTQTDKPGRYKFEELTNEKLAEIERENFGEDSARTVYPRRKDVQELYEKQYALAYETYERLLRAGVAKEAARTVLPVGIYSTMVWTCNARSLMAFLALRNAPTALMEIRDYAAAMEEIFAEVMPKTHEIFAGEANRVAP